MGDGDLPTGIEDVSDVSESDDGEEDYIPQVQMLFFLVKHIFVSLKHPPHPHQFL